MNLSDEFVERDQHQQQNAFVAAPGEMIVDLGANCAAVDNFKRVEKFGIGQ